MSSLQQPEQGKVVLEVQERERRRPVTNSPCLLLEPTPAGRGPGSAQARQGAKQAGPGLPPRPWRAPEYPGSLDKAGPHSNREGLNLQWGGEEGIATRGLC